MDISAQAPMKGVAKCDNHCELQNSVNQWIPERVLHSWDIPGRVPASRLLGIKCNIFGYCACASYLCTLGCKWFVKSFVL